MRIVMAGASGFLGTHLTEKLGAAGHDIVRLVRREPRAKAEIRWRPDRGELDPGALAGADAVINLAGAGIADHRWTNGYKRKMVSSRVNATRTLATTIAGIGREERPAVLVNASGVGYYGDTGDAAVDEDSPPGQGYSPEQCVMWEAATDPASGAGVRVVLLRTGFVLDAAGGLLSRLLLPFRLGLGGRMGSGEQWLPWISLGDWGDAARFLLDRDEIGGPVNIVGPAPIRNKDFVRAIANALHRPAVIPLPGPALRLVAGEVVSEVLSSRRVLPGILTRAGFAYRQPDLDAALRATLHPVRARG